MAEKQVLQTMSTDPKLLELLVCPITKTPLRFETTRNELISDAIGLAFPIRDGIPIMIPNEARHIEEHERKKP